MKRQSSDIGLEATSPCAMASKRAEESSERSFSSSLWHTMTSQAQARAHFLFLSVPGGYIVRVETWNVGSSLTRGYRLRMIREYTVNLLLLSRAVDRGNHSSCDPSPTVVYNYDLI